MTREAETVSIKYTPAFISRVNASSLINLDVSFEDAAQAIALVEKFEKHLRILREWKERVASIRYLAENAKVLAGNIEFKTEKKDINESLVVLTGNSGTMDFNCFVEAIDIVITGYKQQALISLTGVAKNV